MYVYKTLVLILADQKLQHCLIESTMVQPSEKKKRVLPEGVPAFVLQYEPLFSRLIKHGWLGNGTHVDICPIDLPTDFH